MNMDNVTVMGIVLTAMPIGEYDRRLELLTTDFGRISVFARGARKPSSPLVACSRVFAFGEFTLFQGKNSYTLSAAKIHNFFEAMSREFEANCYGSYFLEVCRYFSRENLDGTEMLKLLYVSLRALENGKIEKELVKSIFELKILDVNGIYKAPDKTLLSGPCAYAFRYVETAAMEKLYTFRLAPEVLDEFSKTAARAFETMVDHRFKSLELLGVF